MFDDDRLRALGAKLRHGRLISFRVLDCPEHGGHVSRVDYADHQDNEIGVLLTYRDHVRKYLISEQNSDRPMI